MESTCLTCCLYNAFIENVILGKLLFKKYFFTSSGNVEVSFHISLAL